ncbi:putative CENPB DNA-binding domain-containing protein 1 [Palaemon carinicauda]|uniref:putative CENPB DNA-binding domain-containing protein 1 n=1 Tax=Palaemon carinicauda TaxID=392227 RepID=UPI0035B649F2
MITMEPKREIIKNYREGTCIVTLARAYCRNQSKIGTIINIKEAIKASKSSQDMTVLASGRTSVNDKMERLLLLWIKEKEIAGDTLTQSIILPKASAIFDDLVAAKRDGGDKEISQQAAPEFKACHKWFHLFRARTGIHSVV